MNIPIRSKWILPIIVVAQFFCTSLWFAGNAVIPDLLKTLNAGDGLVANLTSTVQIGFIAGTLCFSLLAIADRFSPSRVFFYCSIIAAVCNLAIALPGITLNPLFVARFLTGFFLAGIYPVGMKIAADHYEQALGKSLGFLVGALVLGTSFPHLLKTMGGFFNWQYVIYIVSFLSLAGGVLMLLLVPDGPFRKPGQRLRLNGMMKGFNNRDFRSAAFGYFGHMWELYAFWTFVPIMLRVHENYFQQGLNVPLLSFLVIGAGSIACVVSGLLSRRYGLKKTATIALFLSALCCLLSPFMLLQPSAALLIVFLFIWGLTVIADSPLFSALVAQNAPAEIKGTSITIVTCIGFAITIISIQLLKWAIAYIDIRYIYLLLAIGPVAGVITLVNNKQKEKR